jgi:hypothetical protein
MTVSPPLTVPDRAGVGVRRVAPCSRRDVLVVASDAQPRRAELHLISTLTSFSTATDVTLAEPHLEAFLPADQATATCLQHRTAT